MVIHERTSNYISNRDFFGAIDIGLPLWLQRAAYSQREPRLKPHRGRYQLLSFARRIAGLSGFLTLI
jgi:hypothetical protein